jgi:sulfide dehydrogenase [flavocytochrome c] flavoprotein chain
VVADWVKKNKGSAARVTVLDANPGITAEKHSFETAISGTHAGVIDYHPGEAVVSVDPKSKTITTKRFDGIDNIFSSYQGDVLNVIPPHAAGQLAQTINLADTATSFGGRFCNVAVLTYESKATPFVHVIGDASVTTQPKAGHIANQEAKVCADAIVRLLSGQQPDPAPVTNSSCYSPITASTASWLSGVFAYDPTTKKMATVGGAASEAATISSEHYKDMFVWFKTLMADTFA